MSLPISIPLLSALAARGIDLKVKQINGVDRMTLTYNGQTFIHRRRNPEATDLVNRTANAIWDLRSPEELRQKLSSSLLWVQVDPSLDEEDGSDPSFPVDLGDISSSIAGDMSPMGEGDIDDFLAANGV